MSAFCIASHAFDQRRSQFSLRYHAPFVKLLLLAVEELMALPQFAYQGVGYRGLKLDGNAELKRKYLDHKTEFVVGQLMTVPAFMSVSTDDSVADDFGDYVFFVFVKVRGARIAPLSQLPKEAEILVPPPSVFRIKAVAKFGGRLTITLEQEACPLSYLSQAAPKSSGAHAVVSGGGAAAVVLSPVATGGSSAAFSPVQSEDPDILALSQSLKAVGVGTSAACLNFAKSLADQGVLSMDRLKKLTVEKAQRVLEKVKMSEIQIDAVMEAIAPPAMVAQDEAAAAQKKVCYWWLWCNVAPCCKTCVTRLCRLRMPPPPRKRRTKLPPPRRRCVLWFAAVCWFQACCMRHASPSTAGRRRRPHCRQTRHH